MGGAVFLSNPTPHILNAGRPGKSGAAGAPAAHPAEGLLAKITTGVKVLLHLTAFEFSTVYYT